MGFGLMLQRMSTSCGTSTVANWLIVWLCLIDGIEEPSSLQVAGCDAFSEYYRLGKWFSVYYTF